VLNSVYTLIMQSARL